MLRGNNYASNCRAAHPLIISQACNTLLLHESRRFTREVQCLQPSQSRQRPPNCYAASTEGIVCKTNGIKNLKECIQDSPRIILTRCKHSSNTTAATATPVHLPERSSARNAVRATRQCCSIGPDAALRSFPATRITKHNQAHAPQAITYTPSTHKDTSSHARKSTARRT